VLTDIEEKCEATETVVFAISSEANGKKNVSAATAACVKVEMHTHEV